MISVIIAGGSGTRLWPLSTPEYPKHLLKVNGESESLLQKTYERAKTFADTVYVVTDASHSDHVKEQLSELEDDQIIIEPARRGTASCIVASLAYVGKKHDEKEAVAILSADHYVRDTDGFKHSFEIAGEVSESSGRIVLVGVEPTNPATGFGYIQKDGIFDKDRYVFNVHSFKEKPDHETAKNYLKTGNYLWNCGYFVGSYATFKEKMIKYSPRLAKNLEELMKTDSREEFEKVYLDFENDTIDYALIEKVDDLLVVPASFDWMDLGSFADLHKASISDDQGNHVLGNVELEAVQNSFVQNHENSKPVAVIGLDNIVVVNTKDGILVARKDLAKEIGVVSKRINGEKK
ncbi:MAG TPA: mannose-1-phosphate guanylyltransferase [Candidatus Saccharimonadales bacterium]|nr:mannose-1-phosphate guanylyltransferase [Candidatus Saccharimonadales bacterium]